jgi:ketosteroid isomerase-like protein
MKNIIVFFLVVTSSCNHKNSQEEMKKQLIDVTSQYNKAWETLDVEKIAAHHSNESFLYWGRGEQVCASNADFRKVFGNILPMMKKWTVKDVSRLTVQVQNEDAAVTSFILKAESVGQDGTISNHGSGALTYVWNKISGEWKIIHIHESSE